MSRHAPIVLSLICLFLIGVAGADRSGTEGAALRGDDAAIATLRDRGPAGLDATLAAYDRLDPAARDDAARRGLDRVAGQKDAHASRLFWYTDLDAALAAAREADKPVLTLRLLGRLDDDLSCANSRFFRTVLYPDERVNTLLRERFILHWQSVADVPRVTVEYSDGRRLERTVVGNSIHYVLDPQGRVMDGLPGLYAPGVFVERMAEAVQRVEALAGLDGAARGNSDAAWHRGQAAGLAMQLTTALAELGVPEAVAAQPEEARRRLILKDRLREIVEAQGLDDAASDQQAAVVLQGPTPDASAANSLTATKAVVSVPLLRALDASELERVADNRVWDILAKRFEAASELGEASSNLIRAKHPTASDANDLTLVKRAAADPVLRVIETLERNIALDTARNEYDLHRRLHGWFAAGEVDVHDLDALNRRVYEELFLMPLDDPWLGLSPEDVYSAIDGGGERAAPAGVQHAAQQAVGEAGA